jgi:DNA repair exonuclease SbcCD nuclease subunit
MNKVACCTDLHFGKSRNSSIILDSQLKFFKEQFIPYLIENNIDTIFMLGDITDCRDHLNLKVMNAMYDLFENHLNKFKIHMLCGNHDIHHKTSTDVNSLKFFNKFDNVTVYEQPEVITVYNKNILMVPWIVNNDEFKQFLSKHQESEICFGHLEINGFKIDNKRIFESDHALKCDSLFDNFKLIFSGHFHTRSKMKRGNSTIQYIGNAYQLTRSDIGDDRGFTVLDLDTLDYEFVNNTKSLKFIKLKYPEKFDRQTIEGNIVDIEVDYDDKFSEDKFQNYVKKIESYKPAIAPIPRFNNIMQLDNSDMSFESLSLKEIIKEYIDTLKLTNKERIFNKIEDLYKECKTEL